MISSLLCSMTDLLGNSIDANCNTKKKEEIIKNYDKFKRNELQYED